MSKTKKSQSRFDELFDEAFDGLRSYYSYLTDANKQVVKDAVSDKYVDSGNNQSDYERLRDAIESIPEVQSQSGLDEDLGSTTVSER